MVEGTHPPSRAALYSLLTSPDAVEWRDKIGVAGAAEGSAKTTTRLLGSEGWVLKTDVALRRERPDELVAIAQEAARRAARSRIWHPSKSWVVMEAEGGFHLLTACRELEVVRAAPSFEERARLWGRVFVWCLDASARHGVGFDIHPSNFGVDGGELFYLDDELYPPNDLRDVGLAIAGRIPEEDEPPARWAWAGERLASDLAPFVRSASDWAELEAGLMDLALVERFDESRGAVRSSLAALARKGRKRRSESRRTCVLADVHANLPALRAVLAAAEALDVDGYLLLGDVVGYGPHPRECIEVLAQLEGLIGIRGNHDHVALLKRPDGDMNRMARVVSEWTAGQLGDAERAWLGALPKERRGDGWLAVHGAPRDPERLYAYVYELTFRENLEVLHEEDLALCFYGHTHVPFVHRRTEDGVAEKLGARDVATDTPATVLLINPGSVGQPRDGDARASFALWDREARRVSFHRAEYPVHETVRDLARAGLPKDLAYRLETAR